MGWTVSVEVAAAEAAASRESELLALFDELAPWAGAVSTTRDGYGATVSIDVESAADAVDVAIELLRTCADRAGLPPGDVVWCEVQTHAHADRALEEPSFPDLVGVAEIALILDVSRQRVSTLARSDQFPAPVAELASGPIWTRDSLHRFVDSWDRRPGPARRAAS